MQNLFVKAAIFNNNNKIFIVMAANFVLSGFNMILQQKIGTYGNPTAPKHSKEKNVCMKF